MGVYSVYFPCCGLLLLAIFEIIFFFSLYSFCIGEDMALESCEGGELFDQITRVS